MKKWLLILFVTFPLMGSDVKFTFCTNDFFQRPRQVKQSFTLAFPGEPTLLEIPEIDQKTYGIADQEGMDFGVSVVIAEACIKSLPMAGVKISSEALLDSWLKSLRESGEFTAVGKKKVKTSFPESYDVTLIHKEGRAIRTRLLRNARFIYILCTRSSDEIYLDLKMIKTNATAKKQFEADTARSLSFFKSFCICK